MNKFRKSENQVTFNSKLKIFPDGNTLTVANKYIFKEDGWELVKKQSSYNARGDPDPPPRGPVVLRRLRPPLKGPFLHTPCLSRPQ